MGRPTLEVADIFRAHGPAWREAQRGQVALHRGEACIPLRLQAVAREPRSAAIPRVEEAVQRQGGYVLDFKAFSDLSLNLLVESSGSGVVGIVDVILAFVTDRRQRTGDMAAKTMVMTNRWFMLASSNITPAS